MPKIFFEIPPIEIDLEAIPKIDTAKAVDDFNKGLKKKKSDVKKNKT